MSCSVRILVALLGLWPALSPGAGADPVQVHVSIKPLQFLVEQIGGERVDVGVVVEAGKSPETYEPTPRRVGALARADVFFGVSMPLEAAWRRQLRQTAATGPEWIDLAEDLPTRGQSDGHDNEHHGAAAGTGHHHGGIDPHAWLSPANAQHMASVIADVLGRLAPGDAAFFRANAEKLQAELELLDREIAEMLAASGVDAFLVYHPAWGHFARAYGLNQMAIETQGKDPGPRGLAEVIRKAQDKRIATLFIDPTHNDRLARTVAEAIDARLEVLDPLAYDYFDNLRRAAQAIAASRS